MTEANINPLLHFVIGGVSGASGTIVTSPLEFLKTRLQSTTGQQFVAGRSLISPSRVRLSTLNGSVTVVKYFG